MKANLISLGLTLAISALVAANPQDDGPNGGGNAPNNGGNSSSDPGRECKILCNIQCESEGQVRTQQGEAVTFSCADDQAVDCTCRPLDATGQPTGGPPNLSPRVRRALPSGEQSVSPPSSQVSPPPVRRADLNLDTPPLPVPTGPPSVPVGSPSGSGASPPPVRRAPQLSETCAQLCTDRCAAQNLKGTVKSCVGSTVECTCGGSARRAEARGTTPVRRAPQSSESCAQLCTDRCAAQNLASSNAYARTEQSSHASAVQ
ncbi:hypothetical protein LX36DRAFT_705002 [Colletotrichum falcatum]|nr:hypothetical protein LX36DRAFT_705002 [Colletotrichum falcatum]